MGLKDLMELVEVRRAFKEPKPRRFKREKDFSFKKYIEFYKEFEEFQKFLKDKEKKEEKKEAKKAWHEELTTAHVAMLFLGTAPVWGPLYFHYMKMLGIW